MSRHHRDGGPAPRRGDARASSATAPSRLARKLRSALQPDLVRLLWGIASNKEEEVRDRLSAARALLDEPSPDLDDLIARVEELEAELEAESRAAEGGQALPPSVEPS